MNRTLVIYHGDCFDGFTAAWIYHHFQDSEAEFFPAKYGDPRPDVKDRDVIIVDFSYKLHEMIEIIREAQSLIVFDHHKTAQHNLIDLPDNRPGLDIHFNMEKCGARMVWDYYCDPTIDIPWLIAYVEDRDLWKQELPNTGAVTARIASVEMTFDHWTDLFRESLATVVEKGEAIEEYIQQYGRKARKEVQFRMVGGYEVPCINLPYMNCSEHVGALAEEHQQFPFAVGFFQRGDGQWQFSLRARGTFDVSHVASGFGGGGHMGAAGFQLDKLPW